MNGSIRTNSAIHGHATNADKRLRQEERRFEAMNPTESIINNLKAMGANPIIKIRKDSKNIVIHVNAPTVTDLEEKELEK